MSEAYAGRGPDGGGAGATDPPVAAGPATTCGAGVASGVGACATGAGESNAAAVQRRGRRRQRPCNCPWRDRSWRWGCLASWYFAAWRTDLRWGGPGSERCWGCLASWYFAAWRTDLRWAGPGSERY